VLAYPDPNVVVGRRLDILPVEIVVRGYLAGTTSTSILTRYQRGERAMYGHRFPDGMRANERLAEAVITPTTKAAAGGHDEPLSEAAILEQGLLTAQQWRTVSEAALALFARGQALAAERGLILADTKYEFGTDAEGRIVLADEIHTPDSSRYWFAESYPERLAAGTAPESFDKDYVRNWVVARCDPYSDPIPDIPPEVVLGAASVYIRAYETITQQTFVLPDPAEVPLERIRRNLAAYLQGDAADGIA
jgi:phosphoribosylaminoimidazole-succinocarboxamide synthase